MRQIFSKSRRDCQLVLTLNIAEEPRSLEGHIPEVTVGDDRTVVIELLLVVPGALLAGVTVPVNQRDDLVIFRITAGAALTDVPVAALGGRRRIVDHDIVDESETRLNRCPFIIYE